MPLPAEESAVANEAEVKTLDRLTLRLIRLAILKSPNTKKNWFFATWNRSKLANDGYSELVVKKARQYDAKESNKINALIMLMWALTALLDGRTDHRLLALAFLGGWAYGLHTYQKSKLSYSDNLLVLDELKQKLGADVLERAEIPEEHPLLETWNHRTDKRPLFWRLDAFFSRK